MRSACAVDYCSITELNDPNVKITELNDPNVKITELNDPNVKLLN